MSFANIQWSPLDYTEAAVIAREAGEELLRRLDWMTLKPSVIVDMGCGVGEMSACLQARYPYAKVVALDASLEMLKYANQASNAFLSLCSDAGCLPLRDKSVDLIYANFLLPWHADAKQLLREWRRVLRPDGVVMFTALGPDTLKEWHHVFPQEIMPVLMDMHDIGDGLLHEKFVDPILDINHYTLTYRNQAKLYHELYASGMLLSPANTIVKEGVLTEENKWSLTYEVIFGHAFVPAEHDEISASEDGVVRVPLSHLRRQLR